MKKSILLLLFVSSLYSQTIKDISNIVGIRDNQLIGYGLIVGLPGTGDKSQFTMQSLQNLLRNSYIKIPTGSIQSKNIATVMVTATLPAFAKQGDKIKLNISSIGDAKSIDGGQLLLTQLKGVDGKVYAIAQGTIYGLKIDGQKKITTGVIYDGGSVENEIKYSLRDEKVITISLLKQDATTALLCENEINKAFGKNIAVAYDTRTIEISKPDDMSIIRFISKVQNIELNSLMKKKVLIDPIKGIIIAGADITINPVTISRETFTLKIKESKVTDDEWNQLQPEKGIDLGQDLQVIGSIKGEGFSVFGEVSIDNALANTRHIPTISDLMRALKLLGISIEERIETIKMLDSLGAIDADVEMVR